MESLAGKRVVVMGLGHFGGGVGVARYCAKHGAKVLVTDLAKADKLTASLARLNDLPIDFRLGDHQASDFTNADLVIINPAVDPRNNPFIQAAKRTGVTLTSEIQMLIDRLPHRNRIVGVTGSAGKSTTTAMIGHILATMIGPEKVHVGGNIGGSLLDVVDDLDESHWVVLELSSFMLEHMQNWSPHVAVVTNIFDNHLDRHETMEQYTQIKMRILQHQTADDFAILDQSVAHWATDCCSQTIIVDQPYQGNLLIPGKHNQLNATLAITACKCADVLPLESIRVIEDFPGLPHRLQFICEHNGVTFFNDSKSTTPAAAKLAIDSFESGTVHLILGGYDKKSDLSDLARHAAIHCAAIYTIGQTGNAIADAAQLVADQSKTSCQIHRCDHLQKAVELANTHAKPGQHIVLSPGCASWDQFSNYQERGRLFAEVIIRVTDNE